MTTAESKRLDLYNALAEFLGTDRAETLMNFLPSQHETDMATRSDLEGLSTRIDNLETAMTNRFDQLNQRLDRIVLTLATGLIAMVAAVIAQGF